MNTKSLLLIILNASYQQSLSGTASIPGELIVSAIGRPQTRSTLHSMRRFKRIALGLFVITLSWVTNLQGTELHIGAASADITPKLPVALMGQFELRIAHTVETPLTANVVALESREGNRSGSIPFLVENEHKPQAAA